MAIANAGGLPVAVYVASASPHEVTLVEQTLEAGFINEIPARLIGDKAYDSDGLDQRLRQDWATEMIARTEGAGREKKPKTAESCVATGGDGRSNASLPGCRAFVGWWSATSIMTRISWLWFNLDASY